MTTPGAPTGNSAPIKVDNRDSGVGGRQTSETTDPREDGAVLARLPWLTPRRIIYATFLWLVLFSIASIAVSNPFADEKTATSNIDYWHVMYLHGLLIGMVGITLLTTASVFRLRWRHAWILIPLGVIVATLFDTVGGIFDRAIPGTIADQVATWVQIIGFFTLDEMLIVISLAFFLDWRAKTDHSRRLSYFVAWLAGVSMLIAAVMGHIAGWILEFGDRPSLLGSFAHFEGEKLTALDSNLITSHSHEMTVAFMVLVIAASVSFYAERSSTSRFLLLRRVGLSMALIGTVAFTVIYIWSGFTSWVIPALFTNHHGVNGVAEDDLLTGFAMFGGLLALVGALLSRATKPVLPALAATWSWLLTILLVVATGYWIEFHETHFGAGSPASGAPSDAVFTWFHQDVGLFLMPTIAVIMLVTSRYVVPRRQDLIAWIAVAGSTVLFAGGMVYVFVDQSLHGTGYVLSTIGLVIIGAAFIGTIWWGFVQHLVNDRV
ncbi:MAG: hypothetical protein M1134_06770 [Actinobacteria bacterium]|nr:hypothetical protein [Actinomycetota bacterium]